MDTGFIFVRPLKCVLRLGTKFTVREKPYQNSEKDLPEVLEARGWYRWIRKAALSPEQCRLLL